MAEMVLLSFLARMLYKRELPPLAPPLPMAITVFTEKSNNNVVHVEKIAENSGVATENSGV